MRHPGAIWLLVCAAGTGVGAGAGDARLLDAVKTGDRVALQRLLGSRVDVNVAEVDGTTALHWAVRADDVETARRLLGAGAAVKAANRYGVTPLSIAATNGNAPMIEALLKAGADPNTATPEGETVLMTAARTGNPAAVNLLLRHGAHVNATEGWLGETALMWAAAENHAEVVTLLLKNGANPNARSKVTGFPKITDGASMQPITMAQGGLTALMLAARQGAVQSAVALSDGGADLNLTDPDGTSALVMAIVNRHNDVAAALLEKGADPNVADSAGMAALYAALDLRSVVTMINRPTPKYTGTVDSLDLMRRLLERGADPNARLKAPVLQRYHNAGDAQLAAGATPLMKAVKAGDLEAMRLLLDKGASATLTTSNYTTALMFAAGLGGGRGRTTEAEALEAIELCLNAGADIDAFNSNGQTAMHIAVERSDAMVKFLAEHGATLDLKDKFGRTPLDIALGVPAAGGGGRGGGPPRPRESTVALLRQLIGKVDAASGARR
jgi:ankyrin repeat protein